MPKITFSRSILAATAGLALFAFTPTPGFTAADPPATPKKCGQHTQGSAAWKRCMGQNLRDDHDIYALGYWQAKSGNYASALDVLRTAKNQADPRVQTMIGFSLRKLGLIDEGMAYYTAALQTDPNLTNTRQYLGEAFLQKGDRSAALGQLAEIAKRCSTTCEDYRLLADAIAKSSV